MLEKPVQLSNNLIQTTLSSSSSSFLVWTRPRTALHRTQTYIFDVDSNDVHSNFGNGPTASAETKSTAAVKAKHDGITARHLDNGVHISHVHSDSKKKSTTSIET